MSPPFEIEPGLAGAARGRAGETSKIRRLGDTMWPNKDLNMCCNSDKSIHRPQDTSKMVGEYGALIPHDSSQAFDQPPHGGCVDGNWVPHHRIYQLNHIGLFLAHIL